MKNAIFATTLLVLGLASRGHAQFGCVAVAEKVPSCGTSCLVSAASQVGCSEIDFNCQCSSSESSLIGILAATCISANCGLQTAQLVIQSAAAVCACAATATAVTAPASLSAGVITSGPSSGPTDTVTATILNPAMSTGGAAAVAIALNARGYMGGGGIISALLAVIAAL